MAIDSFWNYPNMFGSALAYTGKTQRMIAENIERSFDYTSCRRADGKTALRDLRVDGERSTSVEA